MGKESRDLWGNLNLNTATPLSPGMVLKQQARLFDQNIGKGVINAVVYPLAAAQKQQGKDGHLVWGFDFVAPKLNDYTVRLITVSYPLVGGFPATIYRGSLNSSHTHRCEDLEGFKAALKTIFGSEGTINIIQSLWASSK